MRIFSLASRGRTPLPLVPNCKECGIHKSCHSPKMRPVGKGRRSVLVVGDRPGEQEDKQGKPMIGQVGQYLSAVIRKCGYDMRADCVITNAVICFSKDEKKNEAAVDHCKANLIDTVNKVKPEVIVPLGKMAVQSLLSWVWKEDVGEIGRWAGMQIPSQKLNAWICPSWNPSYLLRSRIRGRISPLLEGLFERHIQGAFDLDARPWDELPDYAKAVRVCYSPKEAVRGIRKLLANRGGRPIAFDYETTMLKPDHPDARIYSCALSDGREAVAYPWVGDAIDATSDFLKSDVPKVGYNCKFEDRWTRRILGHWVKNWVWDGMIQAHIVDNRRDITGLKFQAFALFGVDSYDDEVKPFLAARGSNERNRITEAPLEKVLLYNGMDALLEAKVARRQAKQLRVKL